MAVRVELKRPEVLRAIETLIGVLKRQLRKEENEMIKKFIVEDIERYESSKFKGVTELEE